MAFNEYPKLKDLEHNKEAQLKVYESLFKDLFSIQTLYLVQRKDGRTDSGVTCIAINKQIADHLVNTFNEVPLVIEAVRSRNLVERSKELEQSGIKSIRYYISNDDWWSSYCQAIPYFYERI